MTSQRISKIDDEWGGILSHDRRRYLLYCLHLYTPPLTLDDIAHQLTLWENPDTETADLTEQQHIYTSLRQNHLPAVIEANLVTYSSVDDMVGCGPAADAIEPILRYFLPTDLNDIWKARENMPEEITYP